MWLEISVVRIRFVRSSEKLNDDDEREAKGSLLHFMEHPEEQMKLSEDQMRGIGIRNKNNSYFYKKKIVKLYDIHEINVLLERMKDGKSLSNWVLCSSRE